MSNRKLAILGIAAAVSVLWAVIQARVSNRPRGEASGPVYLIQGLDPASIDEIIVGTADNAVTLKRDKNGFVIVSKDNYPAKTSEVNSLVSKCLEIKTSEFITDNPANHEDLQVSEDKAQNVIKFMTPEPNSTVLAGVVIGKTEELGQGTYVRLLASDPQLSNKVYVSPNVPWFGSGPTSYLNQDLISVKREDIESVTLSSPNGQYVLKPKEGSDEAVLDSVPAGKTYKSTEGQNVFTALTSLRFDDVKKRSADLKFDRQYVCKLKDSTVYTLNIAQKDDKTYVACRAEYTDKTEVTKGSDVETPEQLKVKEAKLLARDNAAKFTADHQVWVFEIADWKAKNLTMELAGLLDDEKKPAEEPDAVIPALPLAPITEDATVAPATKEEAAAEPNTATPGSPAGGQAQPVEPKAQDPNAPKTQS